MSVGTQLDVKTLGWLKQQVEETLNPASHALEQYAVDPSDPALLEQCVEATCRVRGAIQMVGIHGPALLAQELETTMRRLAAGEVAQVDDAYEVLMRAMLQLPGYLEQLYHGQQDIPLVLLPLLNDLRALQDADLLTESAFFNPDLSVSCPESRRDPVKATWDVHTVARRFRPGYLAALLGFIRDQQVSKNLKILISVVNNIEQASRSPRLAQLMWVADGFLTALSDASLTPSVAGKILLGRLDQQVRRVIQNGEDSIDAVPPVELLKNLLYYLAQADSPSPSVRELKQAFSLDISLPDEHILTKAKEDLYGFNANLIGNISEQIREELFAVKDALDIAVHSKAGSTEGMESVLNHLNTVADALGMLGLPKFRKLIHDHAQYLRPIIDQRGVLEEEDVMRIAGAMLYIESSLYDLAAPNLDTDTPGNVLPDVEYQRMVRATVEEILKDFAVVKDCVIKYCQTQNDAENLASLSAKLHAIKGTAQMLRYSDQVNLVNAIESYISQEWMAAQNQPDKHQLELLANAITGVEYFFESIVERSVAPELGLRIAEENLTELGYPPRKSLAARVAASVEAPQTKEEKPAREPAKPVIRVIDGKTGKETVHTLEVPLHADDEVAAMAAQFVQPEEVDDELVKVFLGEAEDVLHKIEADTLAWEQDNSDRKILQKLIRSFHTLKGAGRIIGATSFGLLSWSIEELLRKVADGSGAPVAEIFSLLKNVTATLRQLTAEMQGEPVADSSEEIQSLITAAREMRLVVSA